MTSDNRLDTTFLAYLQVQRLARQYLARCEMLKRLEHKQANNTITCDTVLNTHENLKMNPMLKRALTRDEPTSGKPSDSGTSSLSSIPNKHPPPRNLTPENLRLTLARVEEERDLSPAPLRSESADAAAGGEWRRVLSVAAASPWTNAEYAQDKMAEIRDKHTAYCVVHGGHAAMPAEPDPHEGDEWQEDEGMPAGGGASLDSHAVHGPVRHLLKDNAQRAVRLVRKRLQHAHRSTA